MRRLRGHLQVAPRGKRYARLIAQLGRAAETFGLVWPGESVAAERVAHDLEPWLVDETSHGATVHRTYRATPESLAILVATGSLDAWRFPDRPEDLAFYTTSGRCIFGTLSREGRAWLEGTEIVAGLRTEWPRAPLALELLAPATGETAEAELLERWAVLRGLRLRCFGLGAAFLLLFIGVCVPVTAIYRDWRGLALLIGLCVVFTSLSLVQQNRLGRFVCPVCEYAYGSPGLRVAPSVLHSGRCPTCGVYPRLPGKLQSSDIASRSAGRISPDGP